jgi:hypothetical protein
MNDRERHPGSTPMTTEQLQAVTVGQLIPLNNPIDLNPYNSEWPLMYKKLEGRIRGDWESKL